MAGKWRKSSFSFSNGNCVEAADWRKPGRSESGNCVEAAKWRKSSASTHNGQCVEVASGVAVRDTQDRLGPVLKFSAAQWRAFTAALKALDTGEREAYASERIP